MSGSERAGSLAALAVGLFGVVHSLRMPVWSGTEPAEGFFPLLTSAVLTGLAAASLFTTTRADAPATVASWRRVGAYAFALIVYAALFLYAGHAVATLVVFVPLFRFVERLSWVRSLSIAAGTAVVTYVLFDRLLGVSMPRGPW
jgi:putative tricarboxylic transport membrane protein